jgi:hypothetical protein
MISKAQVQALAAGDAWLEKGSKRRRRRSTISCSPSAARKAFRFSAMSSVTC